MKYVAGVCFMTSAFVIDVIFVTHFMYCFRDDVSDVTHQEIANGFHFI